MLRIGRGLLTFSSPILAILCTSVCLHAQTCSQVPAGLVGWWPGDGSFADIQGSNNGTASGPVTFAPGKVDQAFHFEGNPSTSYIVLSNAPELSPTNEITIEAWVKPNFAVGSGSNIILNKRDGCGSNRSYHLSVTNQPYGSLPTGTIVWSASVANDDVYPATVVPNDSQFHHIAGTYDGASMKAYLDGQLVGAKVHSGPIPVTIDPPTIGLQLGCPDDGPHGEIDEVKLYNRALSQAEIAGIVSAGSAGQCKSDFAATIQQPINADGSSIFNAGRGVVPVKFTLKNAGISTCELPPATIALFTISGSPGAVDEQVYIMPSDSGTSFRISGCQYVYNLASKSLQSGDYLVQVLINGIAVGSGRFGLK